MRRIDRDRRGRGIRGSWRVNQNQKGDHFKSIVDASCEFLSKTWSEELDGFEWEIADMPNQQSNQLSRYRIWPSEKTITFYRLPIERIDLRTSQDRRTLIEQVVLQAVAELINKDPWELLDND
jgi:hypothetical protein